VTRSISCFHVSPLITLEARKLGAIRHESRRRWILLNLLIFNECVTVRKATPCTHEYPEPFKENPLCWVVDNVSKPRIRNRGTTAISLGN
jgi:hypothetical protein